MKVLNIHSRIINQPKQKVTGLIETLSNENDKVWPREKWPKIKFKDGLHEGAHGGHGPIRYTINKYNPDKIIEFNFTKPKGFDGIHKFEIKELDIDKTELKHTIDMKTSGLGTSTWLFGVRSLHDALIEDLFDKIENEFGGKMKRTEWSFWVKFLRSILS